MATDRQSTSDGIATDDGPTVVRRNVHGWLALLAVMALFIRLAYCLHQGVPERNSDYLEYSIAAERLLAHGTLVSPFHPDETDPTPSALLPPLYVALVGAVYHVMGVFSHGAFVVLFVLQAAAGSLAVVLVFLAARRLFNERIAWTAAVIATINPTLIGFTPLVWDTSLFILAVAMSICWVARLADRPPTLQAYFGFGLFLGMVALLNPALTLAYPCAILWPLTRQRGWRITRLGGPVAASLLGWALVIAPWTVRNYVHFGEINYVRGGLMLEVWLGVCPEADTDGAAVYPRRFPLRNPAEASKVARLGERPYIAECGRQAMEAIAAAPWRYARLCLLRLVDYWTGTVYTHSKPGKGPWPTSKMRAGVMVFLSAETLVIVAGLCVAGRVPRDVRWMLAIVLVFSLVYILTHTMIRFRAPIEPIMAILTGFALMNKRFGARRGGTPAGKAPPG